MVSEQHVLDALRVVRDPDLHKDIVALNFVKSVRIDGSRIAVTIELTTPACPVKDLMRDQAHAAIAALPGVTAVEVTMTAQVRTANRPEQGPRTPVPGVRNVIAVGAGKGGVGKTTLSVNIAVALAQRGSRVALLDGDVYGPNVPIMLGLKTQLEAIGQKIKPAEKYGVQVVSVGFLTQDDAPIIWRGPMLHGAMQQFFRDVQWEDVDYLIVDMPPGTGDVALSLSQSVPVAGAVVVTTPQKVSLSDTTRAIKMYQKLNIPVIGLVENMSHFACSACGHESDIFGMGGGEQLATEQAIPFLGRVPLYEPVRRGGDSGYPIVLAEPDSPAAQAIFGAAERVAQQVSIASFSGKKLIPLMQV
ncbi:MAG: Mrp/NBP35 family ATP-binding protein [Acidobacteriota bacterium]|nr:Mrp/NBP35 family ATP-binding protein [Acidobacteriota bacterium]